MGPLLRSRAEVRELIEMLFGMVSEVGPGIVVRKWGIGVHMPQVEGAISVVVCPNWPIGFNGIF